MPRVVKKKNGYARRQIFSKCAPLDCKIKPFFNGVYNILASFSDLTNPSVQYSIYVFPGDRPASFVVVALKSFVPSHLTAKISITL